MLAAIESVNLFAVWLEDLLALSFYKSIMAANAEQHVQI